MKWKSLFCLPVLALLLLACGGCQPKSAILLQGKELASWEDLYGQDIDAVAGALGVELSYGGMRNIRDLPEPVLFEELEFTSSCCSSRIPTRSSACGMPIKALWRTFPP